jgi:hypothetical protein
MFNKLQYICSLSMHVCLRATKIESIILHLTCGRASRYLRSQGLGHLIEADLSYGKSLLEITDRTKIIDLARLHRMIKNGRYKTIREYGAGTSTLVIAHAIASATYPYQTLTTIEESEEWLTSVLEKLPPESRARVNGIAAQYVAVGQAGTSSECDLALATSIKEVPDLVYIDGPSLHSLKSPIRGSALLKGWLEPINIDVLSVAHTMRKGSVIVFDERLASYWAVLKGLRRPAIAYSSSLFSINRIILL